MAKRQQKKSQLLKNQITFMGYRFFFVQLFSEYFLHHHDYLHLQIQKLSHSMSV